LISALRIACAAAAIVKASDVIVGKG